MTPDSDTPGAPPPGAEPSPAAPGSPAPEPQAPAERGCAHVVDVSVHQSAGTFTFDVTVSSADTGWEKYADGWEVRDPDGGVLGVRELVHPHESEQPFTRSLRGVEIPALVTEVTIAAHDSVLGFCGKTVTVSLPGRS